MNNRYNLQKERIERIRKEGPVRFILKYGFSFALIFGSFVFVFSNPPISKILLIILVLAGSLLFGFFMWIFMMWHYRDI